MNIRKIAEGRFAVDTAKVGTQDLDREFLVTQVAKLTQDLADAQALLDLCEVAKDQEIDLKPISLSEAVKMEEDVKPVDMPILEELES
jgi:hypothetical protein